MEDFQNAFNDADIVFVAPVYPAGEQPIEGVDAYALADGLRAPRAPHGQDGRQCRRPGRQSCATLRAEGDIVVCMGAGDITKWAAGLADGIAKARAKKK